MDNERMDNCNHRLKNVAITHKYTERYNHITYKDDKKLQLEYQTDKLTDLLPYIDFHVYLNKCDHSIDFLLDYTDNSLSYAVTT